MAHAVGEAGEGQWVALLGRRRGPLERLCLVDIVASLEVTSTRTGADALAKQSGSPLATGKAKRPPPVPFEARPSSPRGPLPERT